MYIAQYANDADLTGAFRSYMERRLQFALGRYGERVGEIAVRVTMEGGGRSRCRISADLRPLGRVVVEETDSDLFLAIDRTMGKIGRVFGRELERSRDARTGRESVRKAA
jgi:putative sigma-54 modulation protein